MGGLSEAGWTNKHGYSRTQKNESHLDRNRMIFHPGVSPWASHWWTSHYTARTSESESWSQNVRTINLPLFVSLAIRTLNLPSFFFLLPSLSYHMRGMNNDRKIRRWGGGGERNDRGGSPPFPHPRHPIYFPFTAFSRFIKLSSPRGCAHHTRAASVSGVSYWHH